MIANQHTEEGAGHAAVRVMWLMWLAVALAVAASLGYLMIAQGILGVGDLPAAESPAGIVYVCAGCYFVGGLLILLHRRWLWITGAVINALVVMFFIMAYQQRSSVMFSPGGLFTKAAQILLEAALIYLIFAYGHRNSAGGVLRDKHSG